MLKSQLLDVKILYLEKVFTSDSLCKKIYQKLCKRQIQHQISTLITRDAHQYGHTGIATTTAKIRKKYWIIKGNVISKRVKQQCTFCRKLEAKVSTQFMADLPLYRQQPFTPPFLYTACDCFGPITVKIGGNKEASIMELSLRA